MVQEPSVTVPVSQCSCKSSRSAKCCGVISAFLSLYNGSLAQCSTFRVERRAQPSGHWLTLMLVHRVRGHSAPQTTRTVPDTKEVELRLSSAWQFDSEYFWLGVLTIVDIWIILNCILCKTFRQRSLRAAFFHTTIDTYAWGGVQYMHLP